MKKRLLRNLGLVVSVGLFAAAMLVIHHKLKGHHLHDIAEEVRQVQLQYVLLALVLTALNYAVLTVYDALALRYIRHHLEYYKLAIASFIGYVFSNNATVLGGSAARYRIYSALGISAGEVAKLVLFCAITFWLGFFTLGGMVFILEHQSIPEKLHLPFNSIWPVGVIFLILVSIYLLVIVIRCKPVIIHGWEFTIPSIAISLGQIAISSLDWLLAASVLYVLLPKGMELSFVKFLGIFMLAQAAGLLSYIPGGLGVFETVIMLLLSDFSETAALTASLLIYRLIYYLFPLIIASGLLAIHEIMPRRVVLVRFGAALGKWGSAIAPHLLAFGCFLAGVILLFSGALPAAKGRLDLLRDLLPLPAIELSHFLGSLTGAGLLILARGLQRRLDVAFHFAVALLFAGIAFSLLKGLDYEEAIIMSIMLVVLVASRKEFYRKAAFTTERFSAGWIAFIAIVLICSVWLGMFSYKHTEYSNDMWWQFALHGDASRFMRATVGVIIFLLFYAGFKLLAPGRPVSVALDNGTVGTIDAIVKASQRTYANLAFLGDKQFVLNEKKNSFIMYGVEGRSWVAMGEPVGPGDEWGDLAWKFIELCDRYDGQPVFYQVQGQNLEFFTDLGLTFIKLGEEAQVALESFSLEGGAHKSLRYTHNKIEHENYIFEIVPQEQTAKMLEVLKGISDAWLAEKNTREKGFSLGNFSPEYIKRFPAALVRKGEQIVAFANIWMGAEKKELSVDLMRYLPSSPDGIMDYLFTELLLWGKQEGYQQFNFGMAPLSGLEDKAMAPFWSKAGALVFRHGEHFYNFQGLRHYKGKFGPQWQAMYLACRGGFALPRILVNVASLISGGLKGTVMK